MGAEYERKFRGTKAAWEYLQQQYSGAFQTIRMETTYYDTPDLDFGKRHCTLRCRRENDTYICTLKTPGKNGQRGEWEMECKSIEAAAPILCKLSGQAQLAALWQAPLIPVCGARFTRQAATVTLPECTLELALDEGSLLGSAKEIPLWEIEIEHKSGDREQTDAFADRLAAEFSLQTEPKSKFARARALG